RGICGYRAGNTIADQKPALSIVACRISNDCCSASRSIVVRIVNDNPAEGVIDRDTIPDRTRNHSDANSTVATGDTVGNYRGSTGVNAAASVVKGARIPDNGFITCRNAKAVCLRGDFLDQVPGGDSQSETLNRSIADRNARHGT